MKNQEQIQIDPQTSWQNEGICNRYSIEKIKDTTLRALYMYFVRYSFGYGKKITNRISQAKIAEDNGLSRKTLISKLKTLEEMKILEIIPPDTYIQGGGSTSCAYAPDYPRGAGVIYVTDDKKSLEKYEKYLKKKKETEVPEREIFFVDKDMQF